MSKNYYVSGEFNVTCDVCSRKIKASESRQRWDGFRVCLDDWEPRHEQDFVRARQDKISVPFTRPKETPAFLLISVLDDNTSTTDTIITEYEANRYIVDTALPTETLLFTYDKYLTDTAIIADALSLQGTGYNNNSDSTAVSDSGSLVLLNYIDMTYFEDVYVGEEYTF